jgi:hypothetical protein
MGTETNIVSNSTVLSSGTNYSLGGMSYTINPDQDVLLEVIAKVISPGGLTAGSVSFHSVNVYYNNQ